MYQIELLGMAIQDAALIHRVIRLKKKELDAILSAYVCSGANVFLLTQITEDFMLNATLNEVEYILLIKAGTETQVLLSDDFKQANSAMARTLVNVILNQAFRDTEFR